MSKKHFIALADTIKEHNRLSNAGLPYVAFSNSQIEALADFCQQQNSDFKKDRWLAYIAGECGQNGGAIKRETVNA
jgi:hypothetical protein